MIQNTSVQARHNALRIQATGANQTFLRLFEAAGRLLVLFRGSEFKDFMVSALPGEYILESDGEVLSSESVLEERPVVRTIEMIGYLQFENQAIVHVMFDGELVARSPAELIEQKVLSFEELKSALITYFDRQSVQLRTRLIPDYKLSYALMGVYPAHEKTGIEATVAKFQSEYVIAERLIKSAKTLDELLAVRPQFPTELLGSVKKSASRPKQTK
jgi:hypothetical protein